MYVIYCYIAVPSPKLIIEISHSGPLYSGVNITLKCTALLDTTLYSNGSVNLTWTCPSNAVCDQNDSVIYGYIFTSVLTFSHLSLTDDGTYTCTGNIIDDTGVGPISSENYTVNVIGEFNNRHSN